MLSQAAEYFGVTRTRTIYERGIQALTQKHSRTMCLQASPPALPSLPSLPSRASQPARLPTLPSRASHPDVSWDCLCSCEKTSPLAVPACQRSNTASAVCGPESCCVAAVRTPFTAGISLVLIEGGEGEGIPL